MITDLLHGETVTVVRRALGGPDEDGVSQVVETTVDVDGCNVQPILSTISINGVEHLADNDSITQRWMVSAPLGLGLHAEDRIRWRGQEFEIWGEPQEYITDFGMLDHASFYIQRFRG